MMLKLLYSFLALAVIFLSACVGAPKPQELPAGHYVGSTQPSMHDSDAQESIVMNYKTNASDPATVNGSIVIYDSHQDAEIFTINVIDHGSWKMITNGQNGMTNPCFTGRVGSTNNKTIGRGYSAAIVNCWIQENFIPGTWTFQGQILIWNPNVTTINYAEYGASIFFHTAS